MSVNNQAQDRYNAPLNRSVDFELVEFRDLEVDDLFHLRNDTVDGNINHCHRKLSLNRFLQKELKKLQFYWM